MYVHCYAHCLNLVLMDSTKSIPQASEFFALLELLYGFMSTNKACSLHPIQKQLIAVEKGHVQVKQIDMYSIRISKTKISDTICSQV